MTVMAFGFKEKGKLSMSHFGSSSDSLYYLSACSSTLFRSLINFLANRRDVECSQTGGIHQNPSRSFIDERGV